jgi:acyl-CoA thioester hydrolase
MKEEIGNDVHVPHWEKEPEVVEMVRFSDCDPFGHLNNSRYIDYFMNARDIHLLNAYRVDLAVYSQELQQNWLVNEHRICYLRPAKLKERIRLRSRLIDFTENETVVESIMASEDGRYLKSLLWSRFTFVNLKTGRATPHPEFITQMLKVTKVDAPEYLKNAFETRVRTVSQELRIKAAKAKANQP